ncbi:hypothetical protein ZEAMMB73_Zm00001d045331 [Zea mays]|uniref:ATP-dependent DNA helicase n=1 Tax=Zea mays TaxID=4577 RepID=A0A1D6NVB5_MAIZE|nr:hypothetical protein ZEAMMB73_Zm00001d045331 [Zea mays]
MINKKRREARQRKKGQNVQANDIVPTIDLLTPGSVHETVSGSGETHLGVVESMHEHHRLCNQTPRRKEGKLEYIRKRRALQADTLNPVSLAIEDPTYTSVVVHPTAYATEHDTIGDAGEGDDWTQPHTTAEITNIGDDDDEGIIFEEDDDENEGYLFTGQCNYDEGTDEDINIHGTQDESTATDVPDPYDNVYNNIPEETHMLKPVPDCGYCTAKKFEYEPPGFCCRGGKVELAPLETPPQLKRLWDSTDSDARHFRDNIRFFNGHFSFTSLYCCLDSMTTNVRDSGIYTFRAQGMMYHNIKSFGREGGAEHKHLELYFYDDDPSLEHRYRKCRADQLQRDKEVIRQIVGILRGNPYSEHLRSMGHVENLDDYYIALNLDQTLNQKTYNAPLTSEVAAVWIEGSERRGQFSKSVMLHGKDRSNHEIRSYHGCYDALSYPLFFPKGELGWHANIPKVGVSMDEVDAYRAIHRASNANDEDAGLFNPILHGKRLFQQFAVDTYIKIESSHLDFIRNNQERLRADLYQGLVYSMVDGDIRAEKVGKRTVLSPSFISGPRDMRRRYMDAMALVRKFGKPDIFLTMTCNPNWDEIRRELLPDQTPQDRPDLVVRVFHAKLQELKHRLTKQDILGKVRAYVYVVEFQKRGLPHAHFLLIMQRKYKLTCPEQYDLLISAEIPSNKYPELRKMVIKHMMHGPCGSLNPNCPCTKGRASCKNQYPRPYSEATLQGKDSYPIYRRRDNGRKEKVRGCELDNRWVVPYNPYLLRLFNCHINVEACGSIKAVKYLFKYIYKGHDRASVVMRDASKAKDDVDEIKQYRDARWVTPPEALWRIYGFELSQISPPVMQLQLHLPNMHMVTFHERQMVERVINRKGADRSMLIAYFEENRMHKEARNILYRDFPEWYTWQQGKVWQRRKRNTGGKVGRIVSALPAEGERFYLRLLLNHVTGATSFADLRTVDGDILPSFREAAQRRGLLEADDTIDECLNEAALYQMPSALRRLFATILVYCEPNDVAELWQRHLDAMSEDYHRSTQSKTHVQQMVLIDIRNILQSMGNDIKTFPLPAIIDIYDNSHGTDREIYEEECIEPTTEDIALKETLNEEQRSAYDKILSVVDTNNGGVFFVDGPGGAGKTYLYKALLAALRSQDKIAVATATSGVAASIMPGGRTAHSRFKIPLTIDDGAVCSFTKQSGTAKLLQKASLIIWDEASMAKRQAIEALDNSMRDITGRTGVPFGGKTIVFGGDFRQVLPVVRKGSRAQIVAASLRSSYLWESMCHLKLVRNMRAQSDPWFAEYLLRVGGGTEEENNDGDVRLPDEVCVPYTGNDHDLDRLIDDIYPKLNENMSNTSYITSRAILTTRNDWVDMINMRMINRFQGEQMMYHSFDTAMDDPNNYYPSEFLNTLTPNGLPPHVLKLKVGCPIMLLRNIDPGNGLCNGTRLVVRGFQKNSIEAEIVFGQHAGMRIFLPRIPLCPSDDEMFPFHFKRKQFPVRLSFAMTVNKAQGQTIPNVGVYLLEPVFSHGQLYVALSRATARSKVKILAIPVIDEKKKKKNWVEKNSTINGATYTKNIVYKEVLTLDCPPEFREAVSNLIFAVARYPDLPELCDLRHIFTERYGNFVEHFVSQEFIQKLDSTEFTNEERFQVMQSVAEELSVSFDAKTQKDVQKLNRITVRHLEKELMEAVELYLNGLPKNGFGAVRFPEAEGNKTVQLNVKPNEAVRDFHIEKENDEVLHCSCLPGGSEHNGGHADSGLRAQRLENQGRPVSPLSGNTSKKAPYTRLNVVNIKNSTEKQANNGFLHDKPQHLADLGYPVQKGQGDPERALTMLPPYVEPKSNIQPMNDDPEKQTPSGYRKPNIPGQTDHLENKNVLRPVSVRRRTAKLPASVDAYVEVPNNAKETNAQITPSSQSKHIGMRNGALNHKNNSGRLMQRMQPEAAETAIDCGNLFPRNANGQMRHNSGRGGDMDEEERMMDKLLMHYSKKGSDLTNNETHTDAAQKVSLHPTGRAMSLPPESVGPSKDAKVPARCTTLQPESPRSAHVHPKMPDFDELAARVKALRKA